MNALLHLSPALYTALTSPALELAGVPVPVYEHVPGPYDGPYVLLQQPTLAKLPGTVGCKRYSCTVLVDLITPFTGAISSGPVDDLLDQVCARLEDQRLALPAPFDCGPATFEPTVAPDPETDKEATFVRRLIRFRWPVTYHVGAAELDLTGVLDGALPFVLS